MRFRKTNWPSVPPKQDYSPTRSAQKPRGYAEIDAVSQLAPDAPEWSVFVKDVMQMPETYILPVQEAVRQQRWKIAPNPIASLRTAAYQEARKVDFR